MMPFDPALAKVIADLKLIPQAARKNLTPALKKAADAVVRQAQSNASWSSRIPRAIAAKVRYGQKTAGVLVRASAKRAPHARPYEGLGQPGSFRHPTFGREPWVTQQRRPFLAPAVHDKQAEAQAAITEVVEDAARASGFR